MALTSKLITTSISSNSDAIYASPVGHSNAVTTMFFCNYSGSDVYLESVNLVSGGTYTNVGVTNRIINHLLIPAGETFTFDSEKIILDSGDAIYATTDANSRLAVTICTLQVS